MSSRIQELVKIAGKFVGYAILTALFEQAFGTRTAKQGKK